ncbi:MAG: hypothetical protein CL610_29275 [Anaerolineaceae bacterium]|nr:hypothetical protein [Anaerolineaceae bacterium]
MALKKALVRHPQSRQPAKPHPQAQPHLREHSIIRLQQIIGNQAVQRLLSAPPQIQRKKFSTQEYQWISDVWDLPEIRLMFQAYDKIPDPILHRVVALDGAEGSTSGVNISIADKSYSERSVYQDASGNPVTTTDENEFKSTLLHELFHFFFNETAHIDPTALITPSVMQTMLIYPDKFGQNKGAYGWFQHPTSGYILHFDLSQTSNILSSDAYVDPETTLGKIKSSGAYESSPMPQSGESISPEEDLAAVMGLYLTSPDSRATLKAQYPKRYKMISGYFDRVLPSIVQQKKKEAEQD